MNTTKHEELLLALRELHELLPEMRFGQLVCNIATVARGPERESVWDVEDDELLDSARQQLEALREKTDVRSYE